MQWTIVCYDAEDSACDLLLRICTTDQHSPNYLASVMTDNFNITTAPTKRLSQIQLIGYNQNELSINLFYTFKEILFSLQDGEHTQKLGSQMQKHAALLLDSCSS